MFNWNDHSLQWGCPHRCIYPTLYFVLLSINNTADTRLLIISSRGCIPIYPLGLFVLLLFLLQLLWINIETADFLLICCRISCLKDIFGCERLTWNSDHRRIPTVRQIERAVHRVVSYVYSGFQCDGLWLGVGSLSPLWSLCFHLVHWSNGVCLQHDLVILLLSFTGLPRKLWQWHTQKERDRPSHLCPIHPDPSLVVVWQDHYAYRVTWMHRGRLNTFCPHISLSPSPTFPLCILERPSQIQYVNRNCATCKKKSISNGFFKNKHLGFGGLQLFFFVQWFRPALVPLPSFTFLFFCGQCLYIALKIFSIMFGINLCKIYAGRGGWVGGGGWWRGGLTGV